MQQSRQTTARKKNVKINFKINVPIIFVGKKAGDRSFTNQRKLLKIKINLNTHVSM